MFIRLQIGIDQIIPVEDDLGTYEEAESIEDQAYYMDFKTEANARAFIDFIANKYEEHRCEVGALDHGDCWCGEGDIEPSPRDTCLCENCVDL